MFGGAVVCEDGEPVIAADGWPEVHYSLLPASEYEVIDTWRTTGLAGTGSHDFTISDAFVPAERTFRLRDLRQRRRPGPLYTWPGMFFANLAGVPLGIARSALQVTEELLADKILVPEMRPARQDIRVRAEIARTHALLGSARSYVFDVLGDFWSTLEVGAEPSLSQRAAFGGMQVHTVRTCLEAVRILADVAGSASIYQSCLLERHGRDLTTMGQHILAQSRISELAGALWLGVESVIEDHPVAREGIL